jgi:hypothetical protein
MMIIITKGNWLVRWKSGRMFTFQLPILVEYENKRSGGHHQGASPADGDAA